MSLHILCIGAHPDDNEVSIGGTAALFRARGDMVKFVSVTDGSKGHFAPEYVADPEALARRRYVEAQNAVDVIGAEYETMGIPDGEIYVTPANTEAMVRLLRSFGQPGKGPDLVLMNRPNDYHRDHRYTAQLVLDASYMLTVPPMCPDTPHLDRMPVFAYWQDDFTEGGVFQPDVVIGIDAVMEQKVAMICYHESQFFEWLPYNAGTLADVPADPTLRCARMAEIYQGRAISIGEKYGLTPPARYAEAFQISEYGRRPDEEETKLLFPLLR